MTSDGIRIAALYAKVYNRLLVPLTAANQAQAPPELRAALAAITRHVDDYADRTRLPARVPSPRRVKLDPNVRKLATRDRYSKCQIRYIKRRHGYALIAGDNSKRHHQ